MPAPERRHRYQEALLWNFAGSYDNHGQAEVEDEYEVIRVQFSDQQAEMMDPKGNLITLDSTAIVFAGVTLLAIMDAEDDRCSD